MLAQNMQFLQSKTVLSIAETLLITLVFMIGCLWMYPVFFDISYMETDFIEYCVSIESISDKRFPVAYKRSQVAGAIPWFFAQRFGLLNGLSVGALVSTGALFAALLVWIRTFNVTWHWRWGLCVLCLLQAPFVAYTRMLNFYPEITLICGLGSIAVMLALQNPTRTRIAAGYFLAACCWLSDARGMVWAIPLTALMLYQFIQDRDWRTHLPAFIVSNIISWKMGSFAFQKYSTPLLRQMDVRPLFDNVSPNNPLYEGPYEYPPDFIWGYSSILDLPATIMALIKQALIPTPPEFADAFPTMPETLTYWSFWLVCILLSIAIIGWKKGKRTLIPLLALVPFLFVYVKLPSMAEPHVRFFSQSLPMFSVPIVFALSLITNHLQRWTLIVVPIVTVILISPLNISWPISRIIMHTHLIGAFPEQETSIREIPMQVGKQIHLLVLPLTERERRMGRKWTEICESRLQQDNVLFPFYETSQWIPK